MWRLKKTKIESKTASNFRKGFQLSCFNQRKPHSSKLKGRWIKSDSMRIVIALFRAGLLANNSPKYGLNSRWYTDRKVFWIGTKEGKQVGWTAKKGK